MEQEVESVAIDKSASKRGDAAPMPQDAPVVIAIQRDYGSDGHEIGIMLSRRLQIPLYDNELLVRASIRSGMSVDQLAEYDERVAAEMMAFLPDRFDARTAGDKLFHQLAGVIRDLGSTETCIIEGRLSDYLLQDNPNLISVLITAPMEYRIANISRKRGLSAKKAEKFVKNMQKGRELFCKRYSKGKWGMHDGKNLVVDTAKFGREGVCEIIARAYEAKLAELGVPLPKPLEKVNIPTEAPYPHEV